MPTPYLVAHPPARTQYRHPRRAFPSGVIVVHTAENIPDYVAFDGGAEAVARFIQGRPDPGSYHDLVDSDSTVNLVAYGDEAFHDATGTNPHSYGLSVATRSDVWPLAPVKWRNGAVEQAAQAARRYAMWLHDASGIVVPGRRISAAQARVRVPGFVTHAELDPARRTDPGKAFPWSQFLARYTTLMGYAPNPPSTPGDDMAVTAPYSFWKFPTSSRVYAIAADMQSGLHVPNPEALRFAAALLHLGGFSTAINTATGDSLEWLEGIIPPADRG